MPTTDYKTGLTFTNVAGAAVDWNNPENVGGTNDNARASPASNAATDWLAGTSDPLDFSEIPTGSTINTIDVNIYWQNAGFINAPYRELEVTLWDTNAAAIGDPLWFDSGSSIDPPSIGTGGWKSYSQTPAAWGLDAGTEATWLAGASIGIRCTNTGSGTIGVDAVRVRVTYTEPSGNQGNAWALYRRRKLRRLASE